MSDRRATFFFSCAVIAALLIPFTPRDFDYVGIVLVLWCAVLGVLSLADAVSQHGRD